MQPISRTSRSQTTSLTATIQCQGQEYTFCLYSRPISLGSDVTIQYYWMDSRGFRHLKSEASAANFRNCVGHWAAAMHSEGRGRDLEQQLHYVTAMCYPLISNCKSFQNIYKDAYLPRHFVASAEPLSKLAASRIHDIVASRDRFQVQQELDAVLGRFEPPGRVLPLLQEAFRRWVGSGLQRLRERDNHGLVDFLGEVDYWICKFRKKGGHVWVRHFLNLFSYESKVSFYRCYANTWVDLIPWLREHRRLDTISERFMRFWHNQNQPIEIPHGRTLGGIVYPTHERLTLGIKDHTGRFVPKSLTWTLPHIGPTHIRDIFNGQVLSLHPLSAFWMQDFDSLATAGRFFTSARYDQVMRHGQAASCPEYWDLIGTILAAAHRYRQALDSQPQQRRSRTGSDKVPPSQADSHAEISVATLLEDFARFQKVICPRCGGPVQHQSLHSAEGPEGEAQVDYRCLQCAHSVSYRFSEAELDRFLLDSDK